MVLIPDSLANYSAQVVTLALSNPIGKFPYPIPREISHLLTLRDIYRVPTNCRFQVDDVEQVWQYTQPFDLIHGRAMAGSIGDWDALFKQAYQNLVPGGWMELQEFDVWIYSDDGTLENAPLCRQWQQALDEASTKFGKKMNIAHLYKGQMEDTGFVDVVDDVYKVRTSTYPEYALVLPKTEKLTRL